PQFKTCETRLDLSRFNGLGVSLMSHISKPAKRLVGYCRISTTAQDLARQRQALKAYGCRLIFEDTASGKSLATSRRKIERLMWIGQCAGTAKIHPRGRVGCIMRVRVKLEASLLL